MIKLLRWIACHTVALVLLAFLLIAFVFREPLFGVKSSSSKTSVADNHALIIQKSEAIASEQKVSDIQAKIETGTETFAKVKETEPPVIKPVVIEAETAVEIQHREQYEFRPADEQPVDDNLKEDLLQKARKAYWNDQLDSASKLYLAYIDQDPDNPDGYGELGNLLSTLGDLDEAANMYRQAADLLMRRGETAQAAQLQEVLDSIRVIQSTSD
jgi:tetratricopeptide (TPR) repeat protein